MKFEIVNIESTPSTNQYLFDLISKDDVDEGLVINTDDQTAGKGMGTNLWESEPGRNLSFSFLLQPEFIKPENQFVITQIVSLAILTVCQKSLKREDVKIKWPNDLYTSTGKLGGILIDMAAEVTGPSHVVIGIGLNVGMPAENHAMIDQAVADLRDTGVPDALNRNHLAAMVINAMVEGCQQFSREGFSAFREDWLSQDMVIGQQVKLISGDRVVTGEACGVDNMGAIELQTESGRLAFSSGEVTLRIA